MFPFLTSRQHTALDGLAKELKDEDESWSSSIVEALLEVALGACAAKAGEFVLNRLVKGAEHSLKEDFVKDLFKEGTLGGLNKAKAALTGPTADVDDFVRAQKDGLDDMNIASMRHFQHVGRYELKTVAQAQQLEEAMATSTMEDAAKFAHDHSRDLWISRLAQEKFGTATYEGERAPRTNMSTQHMRDDANHAAPGYEPEDAPSVEDALAGDCPGVLEVSVELPIITGNEMRGKPHVEVAFLNGVNETIRKQYARTALSEISLPRQLKCSVEGGMPDFTVNLDERGKRYGSFRHHEGAWLQARALVGHPENNGLGEMQREEVGLRLLLAELVPGSILKGLFG
jgi:hypothetical protein